VDDREGTLPAAERAERLLGLMTAEEKIGQLVQPFGWRAYRKEAGRIALDEAFCEAAARGGIGSLYGVLRADPWTEVTLDTGLPPKEGAEVMNAIQRYAIEHSRLGIPILFGEECSHGHMAIGATVFPVPLAIASAWDPELYRELCRAIARETRSRGGAVTYSPVLDVVRDPRWGRTEECYGEDPYLAGELAVAAVEGLQGEALDSDESVVATLKHFVAYGSPEGGRNAAPAHMGPRELHETDLVPFRKAVEAGALSVMPAYNEIDGAPCTSNGELLNGLLRERWGFEGFVVTDCGAIDMLASGHDVAAGGEEAALLALEAGVDMEMSGAMFGKHLLSAWDKGRLPERLLDEAVRRILTVKFRLGLFDRPYVDPERAEAVIGNPAHIALARRAARESVVLLKNRGGVLPLSKSSGTIAVIGPNADNVYNQLGDYTSPQPRGNVVTLLDGIRGKVGAERVLYAPGCRIRGENKEGFANALACAANADVIVVAVGGSSARDFGEGTIDLRTGASVARGDGESDMDCGEGIDRVDLRLSGVQLELVQELCRTGKPVVVVYINGRPIAEPWIDEHADAIAEAWYPGQEGGNGIADVLFGDANPSGRLTVSIPKHVGQLPVYYRGKRTRGKRYLETDVEPAYPFGFGLSYTTFAYSALRVFPETIAPGETAEVRVTVKNVGERTGSDVVQLYVTDVVSSVTKPWKELKGFRKVTLAPGEETIVSFPLDAERLQTIGTNLTPVVEEGEFRIAIGKHAKDETLVASLFVRGSSEPRK